MHLENIVKYIGKLEAKTLFQSKSWDISHDISSIETSNSASSKQRNSVKLILILTKESKWNES